MDEIILNMESLLSQFQKKFVELECVLRDTNKEFFRLKTEYVKCVPLADDCPVMSMKDFVSYMSALEEQDTENDETSQNISELPLDTEDILKSDSEETPALVKPAEKRQRKHSRTNSFGLQGVIMEEEEENMSEDCVSLTEADSSLVPSESQEQNVSTRSSLARPCSIPRPTTLSKTSTTKTMKNDQDNQPGNDNNNVKTNKNIQKNSPRADNNNVKTTKHIQNNSPRTESVKSVKNQLNNEQISSKTPSFQRPLCKKPTNLDFVNIRLVDIYLSCLMMMTMMFRVRPNLSTLPTPQHPEPAMLASATPSPMTPSEDKVPRLDILDQVNNNQLGRICENNKYQIRETSLPSLSQAVLSPTSTPRTKKEADSGEDSGKYSNYSPSSGVSQSQPRNLTRTVAVCSKPNPELVQCRKCGKVKCVQASHNHQSQARTRIKTTTKK